MPTPRKAKGELDPRHQPFLVFIYEEYQQARGVRLVFDASDVGALKRMLSGTIGLDDYDLEHLKWMFLAYLNSRDRFDMEQAHPLRYFCSGINKWAIRLQGNHQKPVSAGTEAARNWLQGRLNKNET